MRFSGAQFFNVSGFDWPAEKSNFFVRSFTDVSDTFLCAISGITGLNPVGWNSSNINGLCTSWDGVRCDQANRVVSLSLYV